MQIITNEKLIRRNRSIARYASIGGLIVLIGGMIVSFTRPELVFIAFTALIVGFLLSQLGMFYTNRWGREPRPDQLLNQALKGLDNKYTLYHYASPVSHLLVGPAGVWVLWPKHQRGVITFERGRWRQKGGGPLQFYLRLFAQEGLGRPDLEIAGEIDSLEKFFNKYFSNGDKPAIHAALIFTNEKAEIQIGDDVQLPVPTLNLKQLKELIRKTAKSKPLSLDKVKEIQSALSPASPANDKKSDDDSAKSGAES